MLKNVIFWITFLILLIMQLDGRAQNEPVSYTITCDSIVSDTTVVDLIDGKYRSIRAVTCADGNSFTHAEPLLDREQLLDLYQKDLKKADDRFQMWDEELTRNLDDRMRIIEKRKRWLIEKRQKERQIARLEKIIENRENR